MIEANSEELQMVKLSAVNNFKITVITVFYDIDRKQKEEIFSRELQNH